MLKSTCRGSSMVEHSFCNRKLMRFHNFKEPYNLEALRNLELYKLIEKKTWQAEALEKKLFLSQPLKIYYGYSDYSQKYCKYIHTVTESSTHLCWGWNPGPLAWQSSVLQIKVMGYPLTRSNATTLSLFKEKRSLNFPQVSAPIGWSSGGNHSHLPESAWVSM